MAIYAHRWDYYGDTRDIAVKNSTLWADVARPINVGTHGNTDGATWVPLAEGTGPGFGAAPYHVSLVICSREPPARAPPGPPHPAAVRAEVRVAAGTRPGDPRGRAGSPRGYPEFPSWALLTADGA